MRLLRLENPELSMNLIPWFIPNKQNAAQMSWELHERLRLKPKETFCLVALKDNIIQAILIAYKRKRDVWLWQAHKRKDFQYTKLMHEGLKYWAKSVNRLKIRIGTTEKHRAYNRRWHYKSCWWDKNTMELVL